MHSYDAILSAPFGALGVCTAAGALVRIEFLPPGTLTQDSTNDLIRSCAEQLAAYFDHAGYRFTVPLAPTGTDFRRRVWAALVDIPSGETRTYGELAGHLGSSARAVGQALGDNPLPILIPCHRVVAANGSLGGFNHSRTGYSLDIKRWLLAHEGVR